MRSGAGKEDRRFGIRRYAGRIKMGETEGSECDSGIHAKGEQRTSKILGRRKGVGMAQGYVIREIWICRY